VCLDPYLGYPEQYLHVALEIRRIDVLFVGSKDTSIPLYVLMLWCVVKHGVTKPCCDLLLLKYKPRAKETEVV